MEKSMQANTVTYFKVK